MQGDKHFFVNEALDHISAYIDYLRSIAGLYITVHHPFGDLEVFNKKIVTYNIQNNPYCLYVKKNPALRKECIRNQTPVVRKCMRRGSYFGCCFAGVYEYVYPFKNCKGDVIGFISVSGYRRDFKQPPRRLDAVARKYVFNAPRLKEIYMSSLSPVIPPKADIDRLIHPLADMLELLMIKTIGTRPKAQKSKYSAYVEILLYLREHYAENISIKLLSEKFHYSPSYISHLFKSFNGFSIRCCVNEIRLEYAKNYLINTDLPVSNIAFNLGYMDPNYFSKVYKKKYGISPLRERDRAIKNEKNT